MAGFCGSPLWISPQNQSYLELTPCFLDTVLVYAPASYIYLVLPLYIGVLRRFTIPANRHNILNITKTVLSCMLCALCVCDVVAHIYTQTTTSQTLYLSTILAPCCRFSTLALSVLWIQYGRYKSDISSGSLLAFWLISCVCAVLTLYHHIIVYTKHLADTSSVYNIVIWSFNSCLVAVQFILAGLADRAQKLKPNECPEEKVAFFSKITYWWLTGLIYAGFKNPLERKDLWTLASWDECSAVVPKFFHQWERELNKTKGSLEHAPQTGPVSKGGPARNGTTSEVSYKTEDNKTYIAVKQPLTSREPSLVQALIRAFYPTFLHGVAYKVFHDALLFVGPFLLKELIIYVHTEDAPAWRGYMYACFMFLAAVAQSLVLHQYFQTSFRLGMHIRTSLVAAVYRKSLKLTSSARRESTVGEIVNLMSVDAQRFVELATYLHMIWSAPLQMVICMYFLWLLLGPSVLAGVLVMLLMIPFNAFIAKVLRTLQITQMKHKDSRIKLMNEVLNGIKVLKLYAWENSFYKNILGIRDAEIKVLRRSAYLNGVSSFIWTCAPFMVSLCTFAVYVLSSDKNILDAEKAFVSLSLFNILRFPLSMLPTLIGSMVQISVSVKRLCTFLKHDEIDDADHDNDDTEIADDKTEKNSENRNGNNGQETKCDLTAIKLKDGDFNWMRGEEKLILKNINLEIKQGSLIAVVGTVGSGKSSLLSAILGEMNNVQGVVKVKGRVAYVSQQAWIQNRTLRDNILFNDKFDSTAYYKTLSSCALMPDLNVLPAGDQTEIGEKGINLSGGQKQRVSVARAVYGKADVYLFDDPLSAVDSQVGKHIFDKVIGPEGMLKCTTRILVTHSLSYLPQMDNILVIDNGAISEQGTYQQLLDVKDGVFAEVLKTYLKQDGEKTEDIEDVISLPDKALSRVRHDTLLSTSSTLESIYASMHSLNINASLEQLNRDCDEVDEKKSNVESPLTRKRLTSVRSNGANNIKEKDKLIEEERAEVGRVKLSVLVTYIRSIGVFICFVIFLLYLLTTCTTIGANFWLSDWADDALERKRDNSTESIEQDRNQRDLRLGVYGAFGFAQGVLIFMASITLAYGCTLASSLLHKQLLLNCLQLPISFYDVTPLGRIVNRFSKDLDSIDVVIPRFLEFWVKCTMHVIGVLFVISISTPLFLIVVVFLGIIYFIVQRVYVAGSRQLKRLESVTRSPIYSHFSETLQGVSTIRAYKQQKRFIQLSDEYIDENNVCTYPTIVSNRWLAIRLEFVGNCVVFFAALFAVIGRDYLTAGIVGLSVSYALNITQTLNWMVRMTSEIESNIVSVERIKEYTDEKTEAAWEKEETKPSADWPTEGRVSIEKYSTRYRAGLDLVLKEVSVSIEPAEKIGIVGRTGAGKSSITMGLFRIMEPSSGRILIDSVDIGTIGLHQLRSKITIIPQEPVLFAGTLRLNLDPCSEYSDEKLWSALEHSHLKPFVMAQAERLEYECAEGGENLSVGQRQLVCLARALLRNTRVLILDEATAAVDLETDDLIQSTIRTEFKSCTVITIAHRLNTIMDYDKLLVLDLGEVAAFDTPAALLEDKDGLFYKMAVDAGLVS